MSEDDESLAPEYTCGMGLADSSELPRRLAAVAAGLAGVLRSHLTALDSRDEASKPEYEAYTELAQAGEQIAERLEALAGQMSGNRNLPMANHDMEAMAQPRMIETFEAFVNAKRELRTFLEAGDQEDEEMLQAMRG